MALSNYTELQAAIAKRLHWTELAMTALIVDYITIAEKRLNRDVKLLAQETESILTATIGSRFIALPALFGAPIALYLTTYLPRIDLEFRLPTAMQVYSSNGPAQFWTLDGSQLATDTPADIAYTYALRYVAEYNLSATATNALLTAYPDLYLYGALVEAADDIRDDALLGRSQQRYAQALQECQDNENANRSISYLTTEFSSSNRQNIIRGM
jgi:hypothetical protein